MKYTKETLSQHSLREFRILCKLPSNTFACFDVLNLEDLLQSLNLADMTLRDEGINTDCVMIPIELILTQQFHNLYEMSGCFSWDKFIKTLGLFSNASIVFYKTNCGINIEL